MGEILLTIAVVATLAAVLNAWRRERLARLSRERLGDMPWESAASSPDRAFHGTKFPPRYRWAPWLLGAAAGFLVWLLVDLHPAYPAAVGLVVALLGGQLEQMLAERRVLEIETQLADAIDLMVGALRAGVSLSGALEGALAETRSPLAEQLGEVVGRIRLGDDPRAVFFAFSERVPLETFLLFSSALSVHWEVGGSLAPTLATVGRTIRDRIELSRRIRSMTAQSRVSTIAVLATTYFIALIMWRSDPPRMEEFFLSTSIGSQLVAGVMLLQAIGIVWSSSMSKVKF